MSFLELRKISKSFGAINALQAVDFKISVGEAVGLMGDNGAGKSTLVKIIAGNLKPTSGQLQVEGRETVFSNPLDARRQGIEIVYQDLALCDNLTAAANVFLGRELRFGFGQFHKLRHAAMNRRAAELFAELKSETRPHDLVERMSGGQRQAVALARTRLSDPRLVLLDEPTAAISVRQVAKVLTRIAQLRDTGHGVILVSHRMGDVFEVCNRVVVLRRGRKIADTAIGQTSPEEVNALITGTLEAA